MEAVEIRPARVDEKGELEALQARASLANAGDREALLAHPDAIEVPREQLQRGQVFVATRAGSICGFASVLPRPDGAAELDALFVEPASWRQGIGRALIERAIEEAQRMSASALHVVGNPHAESFYTATGFERIGTQATRFGVGLLMRRHTRAPLVDEGT
jgi:GNAT superfamily N-acetyltransferase